MSSTLTTPVNPVQVYDKRSYTSFRKQNSAAMLAETKTQLGTVKTVDVVDAGLRVGEKFRQINASIKKMVLEQLMSNTDADTLYQVVDLACGQACDMHKITYLFPKKNVLYVGIDGSKTAIEEAKRRSAGTKWNVHWILADLCDSKMGWIEELKKTGFVPGETKTRKTIVLCCNAIHYMEPSLFWKGVRALEPQFVLLWFVNGDVVEQRSDQWKTHPWFQLQSLDKESYIVQIPGVIILPVQERLIKVPSIVESCQKHWPGIAFQNRNLRSCIELFQHHSLQYQCKSLFSDPSVSALCDLFSTMIIKCFY